MWHRRRREPANGVLLHVRVHRDAGSGTFGMDVLGQPGRLAVLWVLPGLPAATAGIQPRDAIVAVDGVPVDAAAAHTCRSLHQMQCADEVGLVVIRSSQARETIGALRRTGRVCAYVHACNRSFPFARPRARASRSPHLQWRRVCHISKHNGRVFKAMMDVQTLPLPRQYMESVLRYLPGGLSSGDSSTPATPDTLATADMPVTTPSTSGTPSTPSTPSTPTPITPTPGILATQFHLSPPTSQVFI
jgi:hypothetical protein